MAFLRSVPGKLLQAILQMNVSGASSSRVSTAALKSHQHHVSTVTHDSTENLFPQSSHAGGHPSTRGKSRNYENIASDRDLLDVHTKLGGLSLSADTCPQRPLCLSSWPSAGHLEYVCPSQRLSNLPQFVIIENTSRLVVYDLPQTSPLISSIIDPASQEKQSEISDPASSKNVPKEARRILKIRHKKMKKHLLKKLRKRMRFHMRKVKHKRWKRKEAAFQARLSGITARGDSFSAIEWLQIELEKARKGGYYRPIDLFGKPKL